MRQRLMTVLVLVTLLGLVELLRPQSSRAGDCPDIIPVTPSTCQVQPNWRCMASGGGTCGCPCDTPGELCCS